MSKPPMLELPDGARAVGVGTGRGVFAAHVAEPGAGVPVRGSALLVPGFTGSKEDFIALLAPLAAAGWRVAAVDPRGQYETPGADDDRGYRLDALAADLVALAAAFRRDAGERVHLLGHSFGGLVARAAALRPDAAAVWRSVTLMSTGPAGVDAGDAARLRLLLDALGSLDLEAIWQAMKQLDAAASAGGGTVDAGAADPAIEEFLHRRWLGNDPRCLAVTARHLLDEPDQVAELAAVELPLLVLSGERDDAWPVPWQSAMAERLGAAREIVAGAGHSPNADRPAATARALADFWLRSTPAAA